MPERDRVAGAVAAAMARGDRVFQGLGMTVVTAAGGRVELSLTVRDDMLNAHGICHGGVLFSLADTAFAMCCNGRNAVTLAQGGEIRFVAPAEPGETVAAVAEERVVTGRTGVYDVTVTGRNGRLIALFRGHGYRISGKTVPDLDIVD